MQTATTETLTANVLGTAPPAATSPQWTIENCGYSIEKPWAVISGTTVNRRYETKAQAMRRARDLNTGRNHRARA